MKHFKAVIACGLAAVVLLVVAGCSSNSSTATPTSRVATVTRGNLSLDISAAGNLAFSHTEDLPFNMFYSQGTVSAVDVKVGDSVTENETLATLDPTEWQTNLTALENAVTTAERTIATKQQAVDSSNQTVITRQQAVTAAKTALVNDQATIAAKQRAVTQAELGVTQAQLAVTQAQLDVTSANNTINSLSDIAAVLDQIASANQTINTATMILNASTVSGVALSITNRNYFLDQITQSQSFIQQLDAQLKSLLDGTTQMSTPQLQLQLQQDQLNLQNKELALSNAQAAVAVAQAAVTQAQQAVTQAQQTVADDQTAIQFAQQAVTTARQNVTFAEQDLATAQSDYNTAVTNLQNAQAMSPVITAPFAGVVTAVNVAGGDTVQNGTVAVSIADPSQYQASILVNELDIPQVKIGDTATITADAVPNSVFTATVTEISPTATISSGVVNYPVTVELQALTPITSNSTSRSFGASGNTSRSFGASGNSTALSDRLQQAVASGQMTEQQAQQIEQRIASGNFTRPTSSASGSSSSTRPTGGFGGFGGGFFSRSGSSTSSSSSAQNQSQLPDSVVTSYQLRQGMTVTVDISIAEATNVLLVPNGAITTTGGKSYVNVEDASTGKVTQTEVQTGLNDWQNTEITSGLNEGEKVVVPLNTAPATSSSGNNFRGGGGIGILRGG